MLYNWLKFIGVGSWHSALCYIHHDSWLTDGEMNDCTEKQHCWVLLHVLFISVMVSVFMLMSQKFCSWECQMTLWKTTTCTSVIIIRPPGTLLPKAFCFSRDVFFNQSQDLRAPSADRLETLHSDQHMCQLFNASPKIRGSSPKKFYPR